MAVLVTVYLLLGFGLFFTCVMSTVQRLSRHEPAWSVPGTWTNFLLRACIVILCVCIGCSVPHFREIMSIMAAVCCSCNNVFFPLLFAYRLEWSTSAKPMSGLCKAGHACIFTL